MRREGFTLIELLVVVALSAVLMTVGFVYLGAYRSEQNLKLTASELLATVKNTQRLSMSQQSGMKWGVRFRNTTTSAGQSYTVFSGTSYGAGTIGQTYPVRRNISFSNPWTSSTIDTIFNAVSGSPSQPQVISMVSGRQDGMVNDIIMNSLGQLTSKFDTGLVGYLHFDEGTATTTYDASGLGNNGGIVGSPTWQSGSNCKAGGCLGFNGSTDYVSMGDPSNGSLDFGISNFTFAAWIKPTSLNNYDTIFTKQPTVRSGGPHVVINSSGNIQFDFNVYADTITLSSPFTAGTWQHFAMVRKYGTAIYVYRNGVVVGTYTTMGGVNRDFGGNSQDFRVGSTGQPYTGYFPGSIDEAHVYNRALSDAEIADIYNSTR